MHSWHSPIRAGLLLGARAAFWLLCLVDRWATPRHAVRLACDGGPSDGHRLAAHGEGSVYHTYGGTYVQLGTRYVWHPKPGATDETLPAGWYRPHAVRD